jgi:hypothetical protein
LWFKKTSRNIQKGSSISMLETVKVFEAGREAVVAHVQNPVKPTKKEPDKKPPIPIGIYVVHNDFMVEQMEKAQGKKENGDLDTAVEAQARKFEWLLANAVRVDENQITRQRLQFNCGFVTIESAQEAGAIAARQIVQIVNSWKTYGTKPWPSEFGIRFPHDDRNDPYFRAFILKDEGFKKDYFTRTEEETIDDLFAEEAETE